MKIPLGKRYRASSPERWQDIAPAPSLLLPVPPANGQHSTSAAADLTHVNMLSWVLELQAPQVRHAM